MFSRSVVVSFVRPVEFNPAITCVFLNNKVNQAFGAEKNCREFTLCILQQNTASGLQYKKYVYSKMSENVGYGVRIVKIPCFDI